MKIFLEYWGKVGLVGNKKKIVCDTEGYTFVARVERTRAKLIRCTIASIAW